MRRSRTTCLVAASLVLLVGTAAVLWSAGGPEATAPSPASTPPPRRRPEAAQRTRHVTRSLADLARSGELSGHTLLFNRIPNTGSEVVVVLLERLQGANSFRHVRLRAPAPTSLKRPLQEALVNEVTSIVRDKAVPLSFDADVFFLNFTEFDRQSPTYINVVRNPVDRFVSRLYSKRSNANLEECVMKKLPGCAAVNDLSIPYFCGQEERCTFPNDAWALATAKSNVERYYTVVGVLEELNATVEVFEHRLRYFFKGAAQTYFKQLFQPRFERRRRKQHVLASDVLQFLKGVFAGELEFYEFVRQRLFMHLQMLYGHSHR